MTKNQLELVIMNALDHLETAVDDAKKAAIRYDGNGEENLAFEVGFLQARINAALYYLEKSGLMSNTRLFSDEGPEYDSAGFSITAFEFEEGEDEGPEYDSAGFSEADRMQEEEQAHHCDDLACNCSI